MPNIWKCYISNCLVRPTTRLWWFIKCRRFRNSNLLPLPLVLKLGLPLSNSDLRDSDEYIYYTETSVDCADLYRAACIAGGLDGKMVWMTEACIEPFSAVILITPLYLETICVHTDVAQIWVVSEIYHQSFLHHPTQLLMAIARSISDGAQVSV